MKKLLFFLLCFIIIINSALFAYEDDNFKVNDKDWEAEKKSSKSTVFFLNKSISVIAEDTGEEVTRSDLRPYVIVRVSEYSDLNVADFSQKGLEEFKKNFEEKEFSKFAKNYKNTIKDNILKKQPAITKDQAEELVKLAVGDMKINSSSVTKIGNFQAYEMNYKLGPISSKHYIIPTLNKEYYVILQNLDTIDINKVQQWDNFIKSLEIKDKAPTKMNEFLYGNGLKILLGVIILISLVIFKLVRG